MADTQANEPASMVEHCGCSTKTKETRAQLTALEQINENLQKKLDGYIKDNENLVIKYAFVEKKVIDLKALVEEKDGRIKRYDHEIAGLQKQIGTLKVDKQKLQKNIESKTREHENLAREIESSRHCSSQIEVKYKYNIVRLRREAEERMKLETEVLNMRQQLLQHTIAEETHQSAEQMAEMERKVMELQAREIMLKHANDEQGSRVAALQKLNAEQRDSLEKQQKAYNNTINLLKESEAKKEQLGQEIIQLQDTLERQEKHINELKNKFDAATIAAQQLSYMESLLATQGKELEQLTLALDEHKRDIESVKTRELELLALNKDLSEVNCLLQQEITKQEAKTIAITLEYGKFVKMCQEYDAQIVSLANSLAHERQQRAEERLLMAKHIADKTRKLEQAEQDLQQTINELEACRKKYSSLTKDFKREMKHFRHDVDGTITNHEL
ncbi:myosin heavy chain, non-muscle-like [Anopheles ziemanni]|uniref:myosin heavy chain, non-muscle-like n=1 Tax=Anopheles ziemanni TaxID=345580 RepID=UPI00265B6193|nr:myosin heavy chain, non-muscle-like isoform X1 [Anopheles coustani]XP_058175839.1 myosin heavy chain, non-muscle-like [Anopheles ziemanni]